MMKKTIPDINEVVSFLDRNDAPKLAQLRKKFPQFSEELEIGDILTSEHRLPGRHDHPGRCDSLSTPAKCVAAVRRAEI